jgi:hypothetical protein
MVTSVNGVLNTLAIGMDKHEIKLTEERTEEERVRDERK